MSKLGALPRASRFLAIQCGFRYCFMCRQRNVSKINQTQTISFFYSLNFDLHTLPILLLTDWLMIIKIQDAFHRLLIMKHSIALQIGFDTLVMKNHFLTIIKYVRKFGYNFKGSCLCLWRVLNEIKYCIHSSYPIEVQYYIVEHRLTNARLYIGRLRKELKILFYRYPDVHTSTLSPTDICIL